MARVKLNLPTGAIVEKPIVTCFNVNDKKYMILDAENIGSMGLPIILVCKIENEKVVKITDASEWQQAKDYLKGIIAGNAMDYVSVNDTMNADEVYYTQLTLPVASFDVIKNSYKVEEPVAVESPVIEVAQEIPASEPINTDASAPVIDITLPNNEDVPSQEQPVIEVAPVIPVETEITEEKTSEEIDYEEIKTTFMKACENMFDALVSKFQAELDSKK